ncbi:cutinase family protein [Actinoplanes sp. NEAU-A12]|uniref:Cutinase family protein n=1 Tax=Actinoplanes sandaracinus TaxID=3045177 RepID=A0ABT6WW99_9ACTN|nr:cutinase family protein [Actinoplanes sandaracinus]MDI6104019.1 cutinase family protein [Actinoplanes sandaracinus]
MTAYNRWAAEHGHSHETSYRWVNYPNVSLEQLVSYSGNEIVIGAATDAFFDAVDSLSGIIETIQKECGSAKVVLAGYSFGAMAIDIYLASTNSSATSAISGVALYGDPLWFDRSQGDKGLARMLRDILIRIVDRFDLLFDDEEAYPWSPDLVRSVCYAKDPVCGAGFHSNALDQVHQALRHMSSCGTSGVGPHLCYAEHAAGSGGSFLAERALGGS